jgi:hypothetical protein
MIRQCFLAKTGIQFYCETFKHIGLDPATLFRKGGEVVTPRPQQLEPSASNVTETSASIDCSDTRHLPHSGQVQASPVAACTFKSEEHEELLDALSPINDQLASWFSPWRILEIVPFLQSEQNRNDPKLSMNYSRWYDFYSPHSRRLSLTWA